MATTKANIFNALPQHDSDSEGEDRKGGNKNAQNKGPRVRKTGKNLPPTESTNVAQKKAKELRHLDAKQTIQKRKESDLDNPHQLDRHSGTGVSAFDKREKKGGSGAHNWGSYKDDRKFKERAEGEDDEQGVEAEEQEDKTITFDEYHQKSGSQTQQQKNEAKAKITDEHLLKDLGKATKLETRKQRQINEHQETHSRRGIEDHNVAPNTEHANLLGFRTGFKVYDDSAPRKPRGPRTDAKKEGEETTEAPVVNNEITAEGGATAGAEKVEADSKADAHAEGKSRGGRGGYRGGNRGDDDGDQRGGRHLRGGHRGAPRGNFAGGKKPESKGFNPDDESAFPKLG